MSGFPVFPREVKGVHASVDTFAGIWRTHKLGEADKAKTKKSGNGKDGDCDTTPFSFQVGLSLSTRGIDEEYLPDRPTGSDSDEIRYSKYAFGSGLDVLKGRFQVSGGPNGTDAKGQWTGKVQSGRLLFKWNSPKGDQDNGTGTMKLVSKDEAIVLGFPCDDYNAPGEEMGVRLYRMRLGAVGSDDVGRGSRGVASGGGGGGGGSLLASSIVSGVSTVASFASGVAASAARATTATIGSAGYYDDDDEQDDDDDDDEQDDGGGDEEDGMKKKNKNKGKKATNSTSRRVGTRLSSLRTPAWLPTKDQVLGRGKLRDAYEDAAAAASRGYVTVNMHWISLDPLVRRRIIGCLALILVVVAAIKSGPAVVAVSESKFGEQVNDFFNAPHPPYPTTDKLWRAGVRRNRMGSADGETAPCKEDLMALQHSVWLHNTCHFEGPPPPDPNAAKFGSSGKGSGRGAMIDVAINAYLTSVRAIQNKARHEKNQAGNTFWIFDVGGGDVPSTAKIMASLENGMTSGLVQQHEYRVVAFDPDPNAYKAGVAFQQRHPNFMMQQAVVSDFTGPAKVYLTDRKSPFGDSTAVTDSRSVGSSERVTSVEQTVATSLDDAIANAVSNDDDVPLVYLGSGGHELTIMHGLERQLSRKRIHTLFWEHVNPDGIQPGDKKSTDNLNIDAGYQSASELETEVKYLEKHGYFVYVVGYNRQLGKPHLIRVDGDYMTSGMYNSLGCANPTSLILVAVAEGHPTLNEQDTVKSMLTCVPPAPLDGGGDQMGGGAGVVGAMPIPGASGGVGGISGVGTVGTATHGANLNSFKKKKVMLRRLLQFMPVTQQQQRPAKPGMCVCMPAATLDCGTSVTSKCDDQSVLNAPRRFFNVGGSGGTGGMGGMQGGVQGGGGMVGVQGGGFGGQQPMMGAGGVMQQPMQQPMQMPQPMQFGK